MKRFTVAITIIGLSFLMSACGKTEFSGTGDSLSLKSGEVSQIEEGDADGHLLQEIVDDPALGELYACGNKKVLICHVPPGNPAAAHTLCISENAIPAHLEHSAETGEQDVLGACEDLGKKKHCNKDKDKDQVEIESTSRGRR